MGLLFFLVDLRHQLDELHLEGIDHDVSLSKTGETILVPLHLIGHDNSLLLEHLDVRLDQGKIGSGRRIVLPSELVVEFVGTFNHTLMDETRGLAENIKLLSDTELGLIVLEISVGDGEESLSGPRIVPIDGAAVDNGGELQASLSELLSDRGEGQHNMESFSALLHEEGVQRVSCGAILSSGGDLFKDGNLFVIREEVGDLTSVEQVI